MEHSEAYYKLAREVEKYSHPLVQFHVREARISQDVGLLHLDQLIALELHRLGARVIYIQVAAAMISETMGFREKVRCWIESMLIEWVVDSLRGE